VDGDIQAGGQDIETTADAGDVIDNMDVGGSAMFELGNGHWVSFLQLDYLALDTGDVKTPLPGVDIDVEHETTFLTAATGIRFSTGERSTLDVMLGLRYAGFDTRLSVQGAGNIGADADLYDALLVLRPRLNIHGDWYFSPTMSVGAGDTELTWELSPQLMYDACDFEIRIGYRNLNYDFEKSGVQMDQSIHGPMLGLGWRF
jgi:hypothetical protein